MGIEQSMINAVCGDTNPKNPYTWEMGTRVIVINNDGTEAFHGELRDWDHGGGLAVRRDGDMGSLYSIGPGNLKLETPPPALKQARASIKPLFAYLAAPWAAVVVAIVVGILLALLW